VTDQTSSADADTLRLLGGLDVQLRFSMALSRACLSSLATVSEEARKAIDEALSMEEPVIAAAYTNAEASHDLIASTRQWLRARTLLHDRLCSDLELALIAKAAALSETASVDGQDDDVRRLA
jgi:hypothetical protein